MTQFPHVHYVFTEIFSLMHRCTVSAPVPVCSYATSLNHWRPAWYANNSFFGCLFKWGHGGLKMQRKDLNMSLDNYNFGTGQGGDFNNGMWGSTDNVMSKTCYKYTTELALSCPVIQYHHLTKRPDHWDFKTEFSQDLAWKTLIWIIFRQTIVFLDQFMSFEEKEAEASSRV